METSNVVVRGSGMADLIGPYKNTGTIERQSGGRVLITHDSTDKDMDPANMKRWHRSADLVCRIATGKRFKYGLFDLVGCPDRQA